MLVKKHTEAATPLMGRRKISQRWPGAGDACSRTQTVHRKNVMRYAVVFTPQAPGQRAALYRYIAAAASPAIAER
jgi:hypothetical protein